jgi:hypothetical protein
MTLSEYVKKRNGVPIGDSNSLRKNLYRSLGAKNFATFWNYWNPIFGYYLGKKVFKPLKKIIPISLSLVLTFIFCGLIHDFVITIIRGKISFFFSVWFFLMAICVVLSKYFHYNLSKRVWIFRASANLFIISFCLLSTIYLNTNFKFH